MNDSEKVIAALNEVLAEYAYPGAGKDAHPGVKEAIKEFKELPDEEKGEQPLLYWLLGTGTPEYKMGKQESDYAEETPVRSQTYVNCEYAYTKTITIESGDPDHICSQITGRIHAEGWCRLWEEGVRLKRHPF